jgi:hypothetical protein
VLGTSSRQGIIFSLHHHHTPSNLPTSFENSNFLNFLRGRTKNQAIQGFYQLRCYEVYLETDCKINAKSLENIFAKTSKK